MALTLNGIAQGYITDRIVDLLRSGGIASCMVDMGEIRALGARPDATPWRVGVADPVAAAPLSPSVVEVIDKAVATSSPDGFRFDAAGRFNHLLDPRTGLPAACWRNVTVVAPEAATADALSTAFSLMNEGAIARASARRGGIRTHLFDGDRSVTL